MFEDAFLINLLIFLAGQVAAFGFLRTGRVSRGILLMIGGWVLADLALLTRFVFADADHTFRVSLMTLQAYSLIELFLFVFGRVRRRLPALVRRRQQLFRDAFLHYLRNEHHKAIALYRQCLWNDPWDVDSTLALATTLARSGDVRRARSLLRAARALDREARYHDVISEELRRFAVKKPVRAVRTPRARDAEPPPPAPPSAASAAAAGTPVPASHASAAEPPAAETELRAGV